MNGPRRGTTIPPRPTGARGEERSRHYGASGYRGALPPREDDIVERLSWLMDNSIPLGGRFSIGLDPIIGLIPGIGDFIGSAVSSFIVYQAYRRGIPKATVLRMVANVGIDAAVGAVPFAGDFFDFAFKANRKNLELYRESVAGARDHRRDAWFLIAVLAILGGLAAIPILLLAWAMQHVINF